MKDFFEGEILLFNKPKTWTSFDIVNKVRNLISRKYGKKLKIGHTGTLDPLASGLLILCTGKFTKKIEEFSNLNKEYIAKINFGASRPSFDKETEIDNQYETSHISEQLLIDTLKTFEGKQMQMPPIYSAKKINGEKAYINARKGRDVEVRPNEVEIYSINLIETKLPETATIKMDVSKGTYIRSFANDLGKKLNSGAYLDELERTKIGNYNIKDSYTIESFTEFLNNL